jgi:hypoxanthine phosphoribosyltransferase
MTAMEKIYLSWDDLEFALNDAMEEIKNNGFIRHEELSGVYGIPRGGLVLAVCLSHRLKVPLLFEPQPYCAIVDDVLETGRAMQSAINLAATICEGQGKPRHAYATWVWISKNPMLRSGYARYLRDKWVVFPWEDWLQADADAEQYAREHAT